MCFTHFSCDDDTGEFLFWVHCTRCRLSTKYCENKIAVINDWNHDRVSPLEWVALNELLF